MVNLEFSGGQYLRHRYANPPLRTIVCSVLCYEADPSFGVGGRQGEVLVE